MLPTLVRRRAAVLFASAVSASLAAAPIARAEEPWNRHPHLPNVQQKAAGVPADYVFTHNGFFHPSCVIALHSDEVLGRDLVIRGLDGDVHEQISPCAYP